LSRLSKSSFRNEVIAALGGGESSRQDGSVSASPRPPTPPVNSPQASKRSTNQSQNHHHDTVVGYLDCHQPTYSPLEILAAAVAMKKKQPTLTGTASSDYTQQRTDMLQPSFPTALNTMQTSPESLANDKMVELYFSKSPFLVDPRRNIDRCRRSTPSFGSDRLADTSSTARR
jgi:hypothetical protein